MLASDSKRISSAVVAALCAAVAVTALASRADEPARAADRFDRVVLDAGHGGDDHGAEGPAGLLEKELVLDVTRRLKARIESDGVRVVLTRDDDVYVPLDERTAIANRAGADLFVSIHANAASARSARGVEIFFVALEASDDAARQLAERENAAFREASPASPDDPLASILGDLAAADQLRESDEFARLANKEVAALAASVPSRGVKQAPFVVLMGVSMPAALVEIGFITNPAEERDLASPRYRDRVADALARAVFEFADRYDARRGVPRPARDHEPAKSSRDEAATQGGG
ncbi:MAG: N-acetylmuramoyl-L-alanine amidase [Deltaproteobacteria bacterium]|nr:N-acetylmuramoyl-L-alanine amidase [Deltaproteobacteria bacterium]